jgi:exopolyphosphatase/guanosine-5'-triphosphate,3'-diphosphate pyrophosphatase
MDSLVDRAPVIDIGSNTIHLLVADRPHGASIRPIQDEHVHAGLGLAVAGGGPLGEARIRAVAEVVRGYAAEARAQGAHDVLVIGTNAVRVAPDRAALVDAIERTAGVTVRVLSPTEEAELCVAGASLGPLPPPPFLCADIGGGSCDLAAVGPSGVSSAASVVVGSGTLAAHDLAADPPDPSQVGRTAAEIHRRLTDVDSLDRASFAEVVATGGAARRFRQQFDGRRDAVAFPVDALLETVDRLLRVPAAAWPHPARLKRAALIRAGGMILRAIAVRWQASLWRVSPYGIREGALVGSAGGADIKAAVPVRGTEETSGHPHA